MVGLELKIELVTDAAQALDMAAVRNTGRKFMTHDKKKITTKDQVEWFHNVYLKQRYMMFGFVGYYGPKAAAYGLINLIKGDYWLSGAVVPEVKGKGFGRQLFIHLIDFVFNQLAATEVMLDVQEDNVPAQTLYKSLGFEAVDRESDLIIMQLGADNV